MNLSAIITRYRQDATLKDWAIKLYAQKLKLPAMGVAEALILDALVYNGAEAHLFLMRDEKEALYLLNTWEDLLQAQAQNSQNTATKLWFFPATGESKAGVVKAKPEAEFFRNQSLEALANMAKSLPESGTKSGAKLVIISYPEALLDSIPLIKTFAQQQLKLSLGASNGYQAVLETLQAWDFQQQDFVYAVGTFAVRGGIMDIYPYNTEFPIRLEWDGDEIVRLRYFDLKTQLSKETLSSIIIIGKAGATTQRGNLLDWAKDLDLQLWIRDLPKAKQELGQLSTQGIFQNALVWEHTRPNDTQNNSTLNNSKIPWQIEPLPSFARSLPSLLAHIQNLASAGYKIYICAKDLAKAERLCNLLRQEKADLELYPVVLRLAQGLVDCRLKLAIYTEHGFFKRHYSYAHKEIVTTAKAVGSLQNLNQLQVGDYVTHFDYGLGLFSGLQRVETAHGTEERLRLIYKNNDVLWVGIQSLHKLSKWVAKDADTTPELSVLGASNWARLKERAKAKIKHLAIDLLQLYAERSQKQGYAFNPDTPEQTRFEASFLYEDTPDQEQATKEVKQDMQSSKPMDRLICGDVGFGKTEIAMRAAFKAVQDLKQVVLLAPTTVLVFQHFQNFQKRLEGFGVNIDYLSRLKTAKAKTQTLKNLATHKTDIIIGTQALLGKDVKFADLGLLIIDEEQKFGVAAKERLRSIKQNIDCLTLSATPIPRTLQFSLMGIRDISLMKTPPKDRQPVITTIQEFDSDYIRSAILRELERGGQVFFIHNRVQDLEYIFRLLSELLPQASLTYTHGQMEAEELEERLLGFVNHEYDILLSTNIIENGIDIPNVNTILVNRAENFGLSDLHQLRGRVGRGGRQAYCHLLVPSMENLSAVARQKLATICAFADLGSGFQIAMKDLDLRGVGNILGAEQSGFLHEIGIEVYQSLLDETLRELNMASDSVPIYIKDPAVELDIPLSISDEYIRSDAERFNFYSQIAVVNKAEEEAKILAILEDRFGPVPAEIHNLFALRRIRILASQGGIEKIILKNGLLKLFFVSKQAFPHFYESSSFQNVIDYASKTQPKYKATLREHQNRLLFFLEGINSIFEIEKVLLALQSL